MLEIELKAQADKFQIEKLENHNLQGLLSEYELSLESKEKENSQLKEQIQNQEPVVTLHLEEFEKTVKERLLSVGLTQELEGFEGAKFGTNAAFFKFLLDTIESLFDKKGEVLNSDVQQKIELYDSLVGQNKTLENKIEELLAKNRELSKIEESTRLKNVEFEGKIEWAKLVEAENKKYEELVMVLREDLEKKREMLDDIQNSQTFFTQLDSLNRSSQLNKGLENQGRTGPTDHQATLADVRTLLEKFRNDYKFLFDCYTSLKHKMDTLYDEGRLNLANDRASLVEDQSFANSASMALEENPNHNTGFSTLDNLTSKDEYALEAERAKLQSLTQARGFDSGLELRLLASYLFGWQISIASESDSIHRIKTFSVRRNEYEMVVQWDQQSSKIVGVKFNSNLSELLEKNTFFLELIEQEPDNWLKIMRNIDLLITVN